jgi:hypothetical protein
MEPTRFVAFNYVPREAATELRRICSGITPSTNDAERGGLYGEANLVMAEYCFHPGYRAFVLHRTERVPQLTILKFRHEGTHW